MAPLQLAVSHYAAHFAPRGMRSCPSSSSRKATSVAADLGEDDVDGGDT
jgi:hypothetical protein